MTPQQHLNTAENLLTVAAAAQGSQAGPWVANNIMAALCHALIAYAAEAGVPHRAEEFGGSEPGGHPLDPRL